MFMLNKLFESESESVQYAVGYQHSHILSLATMLSRSTFIMALLND